MLLACEVSRYLDFLIKLHSLGFLSYFISTYPLGAS